MKLQIVPRREQTHSSAFLEHYASLRAWALRLTDGEQAEAEDVLHDAFVQFVRLAPELSGIENLGAYLNRLLRNLHLAHITRRLRMQYVDLDAFDYDSLALSIRNVHPLHLRELEDELRSICAWTVARRHDTRAASYLILRFFLGYLPSEICRLCACNRESLEKGLQSARTEIRRIKAAPSWHDLRRSAEQRIDPAPPTALESWLRRTIFSSEGEGCLPPEILRQTLSENTRRRTSIARSLLAHLAGCSICLDHANRLLNIPALSDRSFDDPAGPESNSRDAESFVHSAMRSSEEIFEHRPVRVELCVNAEPQMSFTVQSPRTVLKVDVNRGKPVAFIEAFSQQGVRLLYMPVTSPDEGGEFLQRTLIPFSEGRELSVEIAFRNPKTEIIICYTDPRHYVMPIAATAHSSAFVPGSRVRLAQTWWQRLRVWRSPRRPVRSWSFALLLVLMFLLPVTQDELVMLSAEEVLQRATLWQSHNLQPNTVVHRSFNYVEFRGGIPRDVARVHRLRVEVWSSAAPGPTLRRLIDSAGKTQASTAAPLAATPTDSTAWEYVPDADSFRLLSSSHAVNVRQSSGEIRLSTGNASLVLDRTTFHPLQQSFRFADRDVQIAEVANEVMPLAASPLREKEPEPVPPPVAPLPTLAELDDIELSVRERLHVLQADLGDDIHITRTSREVRVSGVIDPEARRSFIEADLRSVPNVQLALLSPAEAARHEHLLHVEASDGGTLEAPLMGPWLKSQWPAAEERDRHVQQMLLAADRCSEHILALGSLHIRYPETANPRVRALERDHAQKLADQTDLLLSLLPATGAPETQRPDSLDVAALTAKVQRLNQDLEQLLTVHAAQNNQSTASLEQARQNLAEIAYAARSIAP